MNIVYETLMPSIREQIEELEKEISTTKYNKATEQHIGLLKAKIAKLKLTEEKQRKSSSGGGDGYSVKKSGHATVGIIGFPSTGKSTLMNKITDAESEVGAYHFTTLKVVPGILKHKGAIIQVLDLPGIIKGAADGRGRGREVLSALRSVDLILLMLDVFETNIHVLINELEKAGMRLNQSPPDIVITPQERGGITLNTTVELTHLNEDLVGSIFQGYRYVNANVVLRDDVTIDQLIDRLAGNRVYVKAFVTLNKIDLVNPSYINEVKKRLKGWDIIPISAAEDIGLEELKDAVYEKFDFIRVYLKPQGQKADMDEPLVIKRGATVEDICAVLHRDFARKFRYAIVTGPSAKFEGQHVGLNHALDDEDVLTIIIKKG